MRAISLKISETALVQAGRMAELLGISRAAYIRRALNRYNQEATAEIRDRRLTAASHRVRAESMRINTEFAAIEPDPGD